MPWVLTPFYHRQRCVTLSLLCASVSPGYPWPSYKFTGFVGLQQQKWSPLPPFINFQMRISLVQATSSGSLHAHWSGTGGTLKIKKMIVKFSRVFKKYIFYIIYCSFLAFCCLHGQTKKMTLKLREKQSEGLEGNDTRRKWIMRYEQTNELYITELR